MGIALDLILTPEMTAFQDQDPILPLKNLSSALQKFRQSDVPVLMVNQYYLVKYLFVSMLANWKLGFTEKAVLCSITVKQKMPPKAFSRTISSEYKIMRLYSGIKSPDLTTWNLQLNIYRDL